MITTTATRSMIVFRTLLPRHGNAKGLLRVDQMIHALGGVGDREAVRP